MLLDASDGTITPCQELDRQVLGVPPCEVAFNRVRATKEKPFIPKEPNLEYD
jgi:hypothetical protein